tara:strand:+ start:417 stop:917 length:501 start_codon:yes stop_codon:yes gene_type:complete
MRSKKINNGLIVLIFILLLVISRLIPHPPNFSPILAVSIFAGIKFKNDFFAYIIPVLAMIISDFFLGFHSGIFLIYGILIIVAVLSRSFNKIYTACIFSSCFFFLTTNFQVWIMSSSYSKDFIGFFECFSLAIPFFGMTLLSTFFFSYSFFYFHSLIFSIPTYQKI